MSAAARTGSGESVFILPGVSGNRHERGGATWRRWSKFVFSYGYKLRPLRDIIRTYPMTFRGSTGSPPPCSPPLVRGDYRGPFALILPRKDEGRGDYS
jgi:hypothetical protein